MTSNIVNMPVRTGDSPSNVNLAVFFAGADAAFEQAANSICAMLETLTVDQLLLVDERARERYGFGAAGTHLCDIVDEEIYRRHLVKSPDGAA